MGYSGETCRRIKNGAGPARVSSVFRCGLFRRWVRSGRLVLEDGFQHPKLWRGRGEIHFLTLPLGREQQIDGFLVGAEHSQVHLFIVWHRTQPPSGAARSGRLFFLNGSACGGKKEASDSPRRLPAETNKAVQDIPTPHRMSPTQTLISSCKKRGILL